MKHRIIQYIIIIAILSGITGGYFYFQSNAAQKINSSKVNNLTSGLVGYWTFDGADTNTTTVTDKSTGGNNGTLTGTPKPTPTIGKIGQALSFDGTNSYITAGTPNLGITDSITECVWIYPRAITNQHILQYVSSADVDSLGIAISSYYEGRIAAIDFSNWYQVVSTNPASLNTWQHVCATVNIIAGANNDIFKLYINGVFDTEAVDNYNPYIGNNGLMIGQTVNNTQKFNGYIDEPRIYNRVLSPSEITELYQQGQTKINASQDGKLESGLVAYYTMDGADTNWTSSTTGTMTDKSPSGNNTGALTDMSQSTSPTIGKIGQALNFNGNYIIKSGATGLPQGNSPFSTSVWFNFPSLSAANYLVAWGLQTTNQANWFGVYRVSGTTGKLAHAFYGNDLAGSTITLSKDTWYNAVVTYDGTTRKIYLNGTQDASANPAITPAVNGSNLFLGMNTEYDWSFIGKIDEARIYNRALSQSEITELYQQGQTKINASQTNKLTNGLVGYWTMDGQDTNWTSATAGTITDKSGNGRTGTLTSMSQSTDPKIGKIGQGLYFDGTDNYIDMGDVIEFNISDPFSVSFWVKFENISGQLISKWAAGCTAGWYINAGSNKVSFCMNGNNCGWICVTESTTSSLNAWYHYTVTYDGSGSANGIKIYKDIAEVQSIGTNESIDTILNDMPFRIGARGFGGPFFNKGILDEVRVYNRVLSLSEVTELYDMGR